MSYWSLYFLIKTGLYYGGFLGFHWGWNLLFAVALAWPLGHTVVQWTRKWLAWPMAMALLYLDSFLPSPARVFSQLKALSGFSADYMLELLGRAVNWQAILMLMACGVVYALLAQRVRFASFAFVAILSVPLVSTLRTPLQTASAVTPAVQANGGAPTAVPVDPQSRLQAFYQQESQRKLRMPAAAGAGFDVIVLHVCSLAWDDLEFVNERNHPLFNRFDLLLKNFNSASSYSGPAALRLLYGACGQMPHTQFYKNASAECLIFPELERAGFKIGGLLNHDGVYEGFAKSLEQRGGFTGNVAIGNASSERMKSFDGTPIFDDQEVLSTWWDQRLKNGDQPVALYYNTISLHDGNRLPGMTSRSSLDTYKPRLQKLFADFDKFITQLESSGRPVVLLMVPEHGASLRGDKVQISGMREIPGPRITLVPAAVKLIGLKDSPITGPVMVDKPMSYFGLYSLLGDLIADSPYVPGARPLAARLDTLQETAFVSENDDIVVMRDPKGTYVMRSGENGTWVPYAF